MTTEQKAREWAANRYPIDEKRVDTNHVNKLIEKRMIAERAYLAGAAEAVRWIPVSEYDGDISKLPGINHFLFSIYSAKTKRFLKWSIVTGSIVDDVDIVDADGMYTGYNADDVEYFMPIAPLPPHPEKESV